MLTKLFATQLHRLPIPPPMIYLSSCKAFFLSKAFMFLKRFPRYNACQQFLKRNAPVLTLDNGSNSALDRAHLFMLAQRANSGFGLSIQPLKYSRSKLAIAAKMSVLGPIDSHFHYLRAAQGRISCEICVASKASFLNQGPFYQY